jgi:6-phosphogluconolactonase
MYRRMLGTGLYVSPEILKQSHRTLPQGAAPRLRRSALLAFVSLALLSLSTPLVAQFVYVANSSSGSVSGYTINATIGALTLVPGMPSANGLAEGRFPVSLAVDPSGKFLYVGNSTDTDVVGFSINQTTGSLTGLGPPLATGIVPTSMVVEPTGRFVYVANLANSTISGYMIDAATGTLTAVPESPFATGGSPQSIAVDPSGGSAYVANSGRPDLGEVGTVSAFKIDPDSGTLRSIPGSPLSAGLGPTSIAVHPSGTFAYVINGDSSTISGYTIDGSTGALTPIDGSPFAARRGPSSVAVDPKGKFAYVTSLDGKVSAYTINSATGALTTILGSPFAAGVSPRFVTVDPTGRFVYVADLSTNTVLGFLINATTGALTRVQGSPFPTGMGPISIAITPLSKSSADLLLRVVPYPTPPTEGALLSYAFKIWNMGPGIATHEVLTTEVPPGATFSSISISGTAGLGTCTHPAVGASGPVICHEGSRMAPGTTWTVRMTVKVIAPTRTVISETAKASEDTFDPNLVNNSVTVRNTVH